MGVRRGGVGLGHTGQFEHVVGWESTGQTRFFRAGNWVVRVRLYRRVRGTLGPEGGGGGPGPGHEAPLALVGVLPRELVNGVADGQRELPLLLVPCQPPVPPGGPGARSPIAREGRPLQWGEASMPSRLVVGSKKRCRTTGRSRRLREWTRGFWQEHH